MKTTPPIKVKFGKGVLAKDGKTPYAAGTIHAINRFGMKSGYMFSHQSVALLLADDQIREIEIIDQDNVKSVITKTWIAKATQAEIDARWGAVPEISETK